MISEAKITELVHECLEGTDFFLVDIAVSNKNQINIEIDGKGGVPINQCVKVSRHVEHSLDRDVEDFELSVSSPGVGKPLKVFRQYEVNVGRSLQVVLQDDNSVKGKLVEVSEDQIKIKPKKGKEEIEIKLNNIKQTKVLVTF